MSDRVNNTRQYLLENDVVSRQDKNYTFNFCKKTEYLETLKMSLINELHETVASGYGDVNSNICFVFRSEELLQALKPELQRILDTMKFNLWDVYVTFIDKTKTDYKNKYGFLMHELHAVSPKVLYVVEETGMACDTLKKTFAMANINCPFQKLFQLTPQLLVANDECSKAELWNMFKYLINYKE